MLSINRVSNIRLLLFLACVGLSAARVAHGQTQPELTATACAEQKATEQRLNQVYAQVLSRHANDTRFVARTKAAQRAWLTYRSAHLRAIFPGGSSPEYGSTYDMCQCSSMVEVTQRRIKELEQWTEGIEAGEVCTGSRAVKE